MPVHWKHNPPPEKGEAPQAHSLHSPATGSGFGKRPAAALVAPWAAGWVSNTQWEETRSDSWLFIPFCQEQNLSTSCRGIPILFLCSSLWSPHLESPPSLLLTPLHLHSLHGPYPHFEGRRLPAHQHTLTAHTSLQSCLATHSHSPCTRQNMLLCKLPKVLARLHIPGWNKQYPTEPGCLGPSWRWCQQ